MKGWLKTGEGGEGFILYEPHHRIVVEPSEQSFTRVPVAPCGVAKKETQSTVRPRRVEGGGAKQAAATTQRYGGSWCCTLTRLGLLSMAPGGALQDVRTSHSDSVSLPSRPLKQGATVKKKSRHARARESFMVAIWRPRNGSRRVTT